MEVKNNENLTLKAFIILKCFITCFSYHYPDSQYIPGYQEFGPPRVVTITHPTGKNLQLSCDSRNLLYFIKNREHYITWNFKSCGGSSTIHCQTAAKNQGVAVCGNGIFHPCKRKLTIMKPGTNDSGFYSCVVHRKNQLEYNLTVSIYQIEFADTERNLPKLLGEEPNNKKVALSQPIIVECRASSSLFPTYIRWLRRIENSNDMLNNSAINIITYKNFSYHVIQGNKITDPYYIKEAGPLANDIYLSKLIIKTAEHHHTGHYICVAVNTADISYREMFLQVLPPRADKVSQRKAPEFVGEKLINVSTLLPQTAVIECKVQSFLPPIIRWVRRVNQKPLNVPAYRMLPIKHTNNSYQLLNWNFCKDGSSRYHINERGPTQNDIYTSQLVFPITSLLDSGFYACVVMNDMGIVHREIFFNVTPVSLYKDYSLTRTTPVVFLLTSVMLLVIILTMFYWKWKNYNTISHVSSNQNYSHSNIYIDHCNTNLFSTVIINEGKSTY